MSLMSMSNIWEDTTTLNRLQELRDDKRNGSGRLSFDCFNLKCKEDRAYCSEGRRLGTARDGSLALIAVLCGVTSSICKDCEDYNSEEE